MKILKLLIPFVLIFALATPSYAMHLSENRIINRKLTVEEDENIVDSSVEGEEIGKNTQTTTFIMSPSVYLKRVFIPFVMLFAIGPIYLLVEREIKIHKEKRPSQ